MIEIFFLFKIWAYSPSSSPYSPSPREPPWAPLPDHPGVWTGTARAGPPCTRARTCRSHTRGRGSGSQGSRGPGSHTGQRHRHLRHGQPRAWWPPSSLPAQIFLSRPSKPPLWRISSLSSMCQFALRTDQSSSWISLFHPLEVSALTSASGPQRAFLSSFPYFFSLSCCFTHL